MGTAILIVVFPTTLVQGEQNQIFRFEIELSQRASISDPMLVNPKCIWQCNIYLKNCKHTAKKM